jgi:copper chaperone CopZ
MAAASMMASGQQKTQNNFIIEIIKMKKIISIIIMLRCIPAIAQIKSATLTASGLTCSMCSKAIYKSLVKVPFIKTVVPNVEKSTFEITFKDDAKVELDDVKKAVQDAGFSVASMQVKVTFSNADVYNDAHVIAGGSVFHFLDVKKQTLQGDKEITVVDRNYVSVAKYKKYGKYTKMKCFETGMAASCCPKDIGTAKRIYHVTL